MDEQQQQQQQQQEEEEEEDNHEELRMIVRIAPGPACRSRSSRSKRRIMVVGHGTF